jgi:predicted PurR-regulated permease PerM
MIRKIDISHKTIFFATAFFALLWALYQIREVIIVLFVAIIFMSALYPIVEYLHLRLKFPRVLAIIVTYLVVVSIIVGLISIVTIPLIEQTRNLATVLPSKIDDSLPPGAFDRSVLQRELANFTGNAFNYFLAIFSNFITVISILVLTFYLLLERDRLDDLIGQLFIGYEARAKKVVRKLEEKLGAWLRGQVALSIIISVLAYIALLALGIPYALPLAILAGLLEVVPVIGPIISAIPAIGIALMTSPLQALLVAGAFFIIQQLENNLIVPKVMQKAVGLNPLIVILAVAIGGKLLGIAGALLAVPITVVIQIIIEDLLKADSINAEDIP